MTDVTKTTKILKRTDEISQRFSARWMSIHSTQRYKQPRPQGLLRKEAKGSEGPGKGWSRDA